MKRLFPRIVALLLAGTPAIVLPAVVAPTAAAAPLACKQLISNYNSAVIPDLGEVTSTIDLTSYASLGDHVLDVDVAFRINHSFIGDLSISLEAGGETVDVSSRNGGSEDDYGATAPAFFDDAASTPITAATPPFLGTYRPEESLDVFDDLNPGRVWTLRIEDLASGDTGSMYAWAIRLRTEFCDDTDKDGVKDPYDECVGKAGVAPTGCPARNRKVTLVYSVADQEFRGRLSCVTEAVCTQNQPVRLYRVRAGADDLIRRTRTNAAGAYSVSRASPTGKYYTVAPRVYVESVAVCGRAQSPNLTL